jgi:hypothetical protein
LQAHPLFSFLQLHPFFSQDSVFGGSSFGVSGASASFGGISTVVSFFGGSTLFSSRRSGVKENGRTDTLVLLIRTEEEKAEANLEFNGAAILATAVFFNKQEVVLNMLYDLIFFKKKIAQKKIKKNKGKFNKILKKNIDIYIFLILRYSFIKILIDQIFIH